MNYNFCHLGIYVISLILIYVVPKKISKDDWRLIKSDTLLHITFQPLKSGGSGINSLKKMAKIRNNQHKTPFIVACEKYQHYSEDHRVRVI